jgi:Zn finger protein HypA/HybF involved in hydrogenase expression
MTLIACRECGKQVSTDATRCPGCGAYTGNVPEGRKIAARFLFLAAVLAVVWYIFIGF